VLAIAEAWLDLADRIAKRVKTLRAPNNADHPLVQNVLGPDLPGAD
jgi:hypothetical protein